MTAKAHKALTTPMPGRATAGGTSARTVLLAVLLLTGAPTARAEVVLYAPMDSSVEMEPAATGVSASYAGTPRFLGDARKGRSLLMADRAAAEELLYTSRTPLLGEKGSLEFWMQPVAWTGSGRTAPFVLTLELGDAFSAQLFKEEKGSNLLLFVRNGSRTAACFAPVYDWTAKSWHHVVVDRDGADMSLTVDGQRAADCAKPALPPGGIRPDERFYLSIRAAAATAFDELRVYDEVFPPNEREERYVTAALKEIAYAVPVVRIPYATRPPTTVGASIDMEAWEQAAVVTDFCGLFSRGERVAAEQQTRVRLMYDDDHLYLLYESSVPPGGLAGGPQERDVLATADEIEFFVMPKYTETFDYFQFVGNPWGSMYDSRGLRDPSWNGDWLYRCALDKERWRAELRVNSLASIGADRPLEDGVWRVNFCRNWRSGALRDKEWTLWSLVSGGYHDYGRFGRIVFGGAKTVVPRMETIAEISPDGTAVSAVCSLENTYPVPRKIRVRYVLYAEGDFLPSATAARTVLLQPGRKEGLRITHELKAMKKGLVTLEIQDEETGKTYFSQMVKIGVRQ